MKYPDSFQTVVLVITTLYVGLLAASEVNSVCFGETHQGGLNNGVKLPQSGTNFKAYSDLGWYLGRTYVHSEVAAVIVESYAVLEKMHPQLKYVYAETGWSKGGEFLPHKTHQNGLSVDFMVPVINQNGLSVELDLTFENKFGYDLEFDHMGELKPYHIDFESLALHLKTLDELAKVNGFTIKRVFFAPDLQALLFATENGNYLKANIAFNSRQAWVRHDEHYHVDFSINCSPFKDFK